MSTTTVAPAAGWAIRVVTKRRERGQSLIPLYAAAFPDPVEAKEAVKHRDHLAANEKLMVVTSLARLTLDRLGLAPGDVWMLS